LIQRISIEVSNQCSKGCWFCYNGSGPGGRTGWTPDELVDFVTDCARAGTQAVSFGGGEPLEWDGIFETLTRLQGTLFRSLTTHGLLLERHFVSLLAAAPDKVHVSVHFPGNDREVQRVIRQVHQLADCGISSGVNLLVARSGLEEARRAARELRLSGISNERITYLPMRGQDTPTPGELAVVAGREAFQSMTCLPACEASPRFCSIGWDRQVGWCSYTGARTPLRVLTAFGLQQAMDGLALESCGEAPQDRPLHRLETKSDAIPAAHSMDTDWFAVDSEGRIALMSSGEAGAVPGSSSEVHIEELRRLAVTMPRRRSVIDPQGLTWPDDAPSHMNPPHAEDWARNVFMVVDRIAGLPDELLEKNRRMDALNGVGFYIERLSASAWRALHDSGRCQECHPGYVVTYPDMQLAGELGLFGYDHHLTENWVAGPYSRIVLPSHPLLIEDLPEELARRIASTHYPFRFEETLQIQPVAHHRSLAWSSEYLDLETRAQLPIPE
jgi:hypothetical protein